MLCNGTLLMRGAALVTLLPPLQAETFLVQSHGMGEWVKIALAQQQGICAATRVELPARFFWRAWRAVLGRAAVPAALPLDDLLSAATYTINYDRARVWVLGHAWSLGVEEQFYLLWPVAFTLLAMRGRVRWVVAVLALGPISRLVTWRFFPSWQLMIGETFPTIADALASGVLLAIMRDRWHAMPSYRRLLRSGMLGLLPLGILLLNKPNAEVTVFGWLLGETMINFAIVLVIDRVSSFPDTLSARFLNLPPMVFLGHLSYSLYLWQQPFLPAAPAWVGQTFPVNIGLLFLAALASFYLIEQPFLRLKARVGGSVGRGARG